MEMKEMSICIVGKDKADFLRQCIEHSLKLSQQISYVDLESKDNSVEVAEAGGLFVIKSASLQEVPEPLKEFHKSKWILFLRPDEMIVYESVPQIMQTLQRSKAIGYSVIIKTPVSTETLEDYRWIKIPGKRNRYSPESLIVSKIEIRIVRKQYFVKALNLMISSSPDRIFSFTSQIFNDLQIHSFHQAERDQKEKDPNGDKEVEMKFLRGESPIQFDGDYGMAELGDDFIIFNAVNKDNLDKYYRGLEMGFGNEKMYLATLNYLGKFGNIGKARVFFETWLEKWDVFDTPEPYNLGAKIYLNLFEFEKAASLFRKHIELTPDKIAAGSHSSLAMALLYLGKKDEAEKHLKQALQVRDDTFDSILLETIQDANWRPPKLSFCMIARDEQSNISKALDSLTGIADEIIVVDTGSKDETKDIASRYNAMIIDMDWEDDFSKARNAGLLKATGDYTICLDADEYIDPRERIKLAIFKMILPYYRQSFAFRTIVAMEDEDEETSALFCVPKDIKPDYPVRVFPTRKEIVFEGTVFESVDKSVTDLGINIVANDMFKIAHAGTDRKWRETRKGPAVLKAYETNPNPQIAMQAALYKLKLGDIDAALNWLEIAPFTYPRLWMKIITFYSRLGQTEKVAGIIKRALSEYPDSLELRLAKAELHFADSDYEAVYATLDSNMDKIDKELAREDRAIAAYLYGMALLEKGNPGQGIKFLSDARELDSWNMRYKIGGIYALTIMEEWEGAIHALSEVLQEEKVHLTEVIDDFTDLGNILTKLIHHFEINDRIEASKLCRKIFSNIIQNKISEPEKIEKMINYLAIPQTKKEQV